MIGAVPPPAETPLKALYRHAAERPDAIALVLGDDEWSYQRLSDNVARLSSGLRRIGIKPGDRIMMVVRTSPTYAVFAFAAMVTGAILAPLKTDFKATELDHFLCVLQPALFVYETDLQHIVSQINPERLEEVQTFLTDDHSARSWRHLLHEVHQADAVLPEDDESVFLVLATSGTTAGRS